MLRAIALLALMTLVVTPAFAQKQKRKKSAEGGAAKKQESSQPAPVAPAAAQKDDEEDKGPWKGLTYRLVGPFRGGRVVPASRGVGPAQNSFFWCAGEGVR